MNAMMSRKVRSLDHGWTKRAGKAMTIPYSTEVERSMERAKSKKGHPIEESFML